MEFHKAFEKILERSPLEEMVSNKELGKIENLDKPLNECNDTPKTKDAVNNNCNENDNREKKGLSDEEKERIKEQTGWSDEIIDKIGSMEEAEIYMKANLKEAEIDGKKCLIRDDIDWEQKDSMGRTNKERAEQGLAPINKDGKTIELHHIGQEDDSPLAELTQEEHRGQGNDTVLHDKNKESEIDRGAFTKTRNEHWKSRAKEGE